MFQTMETSLTRIPARRDQVDLSPITLPRRETANRGDHFSAVRCIFDEKLLGMRCRFRLDFRGVSFSLTCQRTYRRETGMTG